MMFCMQFVALEEIKLSSQSELTYLQVDECRLNDFEIEVGGMDQAPFLLRTASACLVNPPVLTSQTV